MEPRITNHIGALLEYCQKHQKPAPTWSDPTNEREALPHNPEFVISVTLDPYGTCEGRGKSKKEAKKNAAKAMLDAIGPINLMSPKSLVTHKSRLSDSSIRDRSPLTASPRLVDQTNIVTIATSTPNSLKTPDKRQFISYQDIDNEIMLDCDYVEPSAPYMDTGTPCMVTDTLNMLSHHDEHVTPGACAKPLDRLCIDDSTLFDHSLLEFTHGGDIPDHMEHSASYCIDSCEVVRNDSAGCLDDSLYMRNVEGGTAEDDLSGKQSIVYDKSLCGTLPPRESAVESLDLWLKLSNFQVQYEYLSCGSSFVCFVRLAITPEPIVCCGYADTKEEATLRAAETALEADTYARWRWELSFQEVY